MSDLPEDDIKAKVLEMWNSTPATLGQIARRLGRSKASVAGIVWKAQRRAQAFRRTNKSRPLSTAEALVVRNAVLRATRDRGSVSQLAEKCGVSLSVLYNIRSDHYRPGVLLRERLKEAGVLPEK